VIAAPWIVSQRPVTRYLLSFVNEALCGAVEIDKLSLTWFGPSSVEGLAVFDPRAQSVLSARQVRLPAGAWQMITNPQAFGTLLIDTPVVVLELDDDNGISLAEAIRPARSARGGAVGQKKTAPGDDANTASLPALGGTIRINNGSVRLTRGTDEGYQVTELNGQFDIATLNDLRGRLDVKLSGGSNLSAELSVANLASGGTFDIRGASGTVKASMDRPAEIGPLADLLLRQAGLAGEGVFELEASIQPDDCSARFTGQVARLVTKGLADRGAEPLDATVNGTVSLRNSELAASVDLSGTAGTSHTELHYRVGDALPEFTSDRVLAALVEGDSLSLPEFTMSGDGELDLAAIDRAVPGLLPLRAGQSLTGATLTVSALNVAGGSLPRVAGSIRLANVSLKDAERTMTVSPISIEVAARLERDMGIMIERADLVSGFATVRASGSMKELHAQFESDFAILTGELARMVDLGDLSCAGRVDGTLSVSRQPDSRASTAVEVTAVDVHYAAGDRRVDLPKLTMAQSGQVQIEAGKPTRIEATKVRVDLNGEVVVDGAGWYDLNTGALSSKVSIDQMDIAALGRRALAFGIGAVGRYSGSVSGEAAMDRLSASEPLRSSGRVVGRRVAADGKVLLDGDALVSWSEVTFDPAGGRMAVGLAKLDTEIGSVTASDVRAQTAAFMVEGGHLSGSIDLARLLSAVSIVAQREEVPAIRGRLAFETGVTMANGSIKVGGTGDIAPLEIGSGKDAVRQDRVQFGYDATLDTQAHRLTLGPTRLSSTLLTADVNGSIEGYDADMVAALHGRYDASWKEITALLHELIPATADLLLIEGRCQSEFTVTGPLRKTGVEPAFRDATAQVSFGWDAAQVAGVELERAVLSPRMAGGRIELPRTSIPAAQGKVNLAGSLDLQSAAPTLRAPGKNKILDGVKVTPELCRTILSRINPIFYEVAVAAGTVDLFANDLVVPFSDAGRAESKGTGRLELVEMKLIPAGLLQELLALGGIVDQSVVSVGVSGTDFIVRDGRIHYRDFALRFPGGFDMKFFGSAGLDGTLDLSVSLPVRAAMLERLGVGRSASQYAEQLTGARVDVPIVGTREDPILDLSKIDTAALVERALKGSVEKTIGGLLEDILRGKDEPDKGKDKNKARTGTPDTKQPTRKPKPKAKPKQP